MPYVKCLSVHSTPARSIAYIVNKDKTDNLIYVTGLNCSAVPTLAYDEMKSVFENYSKDRFDEKKSENKKTSVKLFHFIQSFSPNENITPELAHNIANEWAEKAFGKERQIIISTHTDKKHIHSHIIINPYDFSGKKYSSNKKSLEKVRKFSDEISLKYDIKPITENNDKKSLSYKEWDARKKGISWKQSIKNRIDALVYNVENFEQLIDSLKADGYEIKRGKYIAVKAPEQQRFIRIKSLGNGYDEQSLTDRIILAVKEKNTPDKTECKEKNHIEKLYIKRFNDVKKLVLAGSKIQKKFDRKQPYSLKNDYTIGHIVNQLQIIRNDKISSINMLENRLEDIEKIYESTRNQINSLLKKEEQYRTLISNLKIYFQLKDKPSESISEAEKIKFKIAQSYIKKYNIPDSLNTLDSVQKASEKLYIQSEKLTENFKAYEEKIRQYRLIKNWYDDMSHKDFITKLIEQKKHTEKLKK
mgnify:CR=1 FL=1